MLKLTNLHLNSRRGFTLVELLVVIVVIAILASIAVVAYNGIQDRAKDTATRADISNIDKKFRLYDLSSGGLPSDESEMRGDGYDGIVNKITVADGKPFYASTQTAQGEYFLFTIGTRADIYFYSFVDKHWSTIGWSYSDSNLNMYEESGGFWGTANPDGSRPCTQKHIEDCHDGVPT